VPVLTKAYPNPTSGLSSIVFNNKQQERVIIRVFNSNGLLVKTLVDKSFPEGNNQLTFDMNGLASGVYFIKVNDTTLRLVKE
jgi:hypothetical protein